MSSAQSLLHVVNTDVGNKQAGWSALYLVKLETPVKNLFSNKVQHGSIGN